MFVFVLFCIKTRYIRQYAPRFKTKKSLKTLHKIKPNWFLEMPLTTSEAKTFLATNNYMFKMRAFAKNYRKNKSGYLNLDFEYLKKFSIIDMAFRSLILELSLVCEHLIKTRLCAVMSENPLDDGYGIVREFLTFDKEAQIQNELGKPIKCFPATLKRYDTKRGRNFYIDKMLDKFYANDVANLPVWILVEVLEFGELLLFYRFYMEKFRLPEGKQRGDFLWLCRSETEEKINSCKRFLNDYNSKFKLSKLDFSLFYAVKNLRNAAAHNNCVLHGISDGSQRDFKILNKLKTQLRENKILLEKDTRSKIVKLSESEESRLKIPVIHDFLCLILALDRLCPKDNELKLLIIEKISSFFTMCEKQKRCFTNKKMIENYLFVKNIVLSFLKI